MHCIGGERILQSGVPKIYGGSTSGCAKHTKHAKHANSRGVWGHSPQENFENLVSGD